MLQLERKSRMCMHLDVFITRWVAIDIQTLQGKMDCLDPL